MNTKIIEGSVGDEEFNVIATILAMPFGIEAERGRMSSTPVSMPDIISQLGQPSEKLASWPTRAPIHGIWHRMNEDLYIFDLGVSRVLYRQLNSEKI